MIQRIQTYIWAIFEFSCRSHWRNLWPFLASLPARQPSSHRRSGEGFLLLFDVAALHTSPDHTSWGDRVKLEMLKDLTGKWVCPKMSIPKIIGDFYRGKLMSIQSFNCASHNGFLGYLDILILREHTFWGSLMLHPTNASSVHPNISSSIAHRQRRVEVLL